MQDRDALASSWARVGVGGRRIGAVFLEAGQRRRVRIFGASSAARRRRPLARQSRQRACVTVFALAERRLTFSMTAPKAALGAPPTTVASRAGVARIERCGAAAPLEKIGLQMGAARGVVELLSVHHRAALPALELVLPQRAQGLALGPDGSVGMRAGLPSMAQRVATAQRVAYNDGAGAVARVPLQADGLGRGAVWLKLKEGCHRLSLHPQGRAPRLPESAIVFEIARGGGPAKSPPLRRARAVDFDPAVSFCLAATERLAVRFAGLAAAAPLTIVDARWPLPSGLPEGWGRRVRERFAWALQRRQAPILRERPARTWLGIQGTTRVPIEVTPGRCYLVAFALRDGVASASRLTVEQVVASRHDISRGPAEGAAVSFCAEPFSEGATLQVELRASRASWLLALWPLEDAL